MSDPFAGLTIPVDEPARLELLHPKTNTVIRDADGNPAWIDVLCMDSQAYRDHERRVSAKLTSTRRRGQAYNADESEADGVDMLASLTRGWNLIGLDGKPIDFAYSPENAKALYRNRGLNWIKRQVSNHIGDIANFVKASSPTS